jgi:hypothetical protein
MTASPLMTEIGGIQFRRTTPINEGGHVFVQVRGAGERGQRPLLGTLVMSTAEWVAFCEVEPELGTARLTVTEIWRGTTREDAMAVRVEQMRRRDEAMGKGE